MPDDYCIFCDSTSDTYRWLLYEGANFRVLCDSHPITEGHLLIIPKQHIACVGAYSPELLSEFKTLYERFSRFVQIAYGSLGTFEHGVFDQTVSHSHIHILPFVGSVGEIVPEGEKYLRPLADFGILADELKRHGGYLFFSIGRSKWLVDVSLAEPRFFRDRFALAAGRPEVADWKAVRSNLIIMSRFASQNDHTLKLWQTFAKGSEEET